MNESCIYSLNYLETQKQLWGEGDSKARATQPQVRKSGIYSKPSESYFIHIYNKSSNNIMKIIVAMT